MKKNAVISFIFLMFLLMFGFSTNAAAAITSTCGQCHYNDMNTIATDDDIDIVADFNSPNVAMVDKLTACKKCHYLAYHNGAWTSTSFGWYSSANSPYASPAALHKAHDGKKGPATLLSCSRCHGTVDCNTCHSVVPHKSHSSTIYPAITLLLADSKTFANRDITCATSKCHNQMPNVVKARPDGTQLCLNCHKYDKSGHGDVSALHTSTYLPDQPLPFDCSQCHKNSLNGEHESRVDANNQPYNCVTCHKSTRTDVKAAIENHNKNCSACHIVHENINTLHTTSSLDDKCQTCHKNVLNEEHLSNDKTTAGKNFTCNTCHVNAKIEVNRTIAAQKVNCSGCHKEGHNLQFADQVPSDIPLYSGFQYTQPIEASIFSGETDAPANYEKGQLVISARRSDVSVSQFWNYYKDQLLTLGWKVNGAEPSVDATDISVEFVKGTRYLTLKYFNTENSDGSGKTLSGYKAVIWYK